MPAKKKALKHCNNAIEIIDILNIFFILKKINISNHFLYLAKILKLQYQTMFKTRFYMLSFFSLLLIMSCKLTKQSSTNLEVKSTEKQIADPNIISFLVLNIHTDKIKTTNIVSLISKKEANGTLKKQQEVQAVNYLSIYAYSENKVIDSTFIEHPLYKHLEYTDDNNKFAVLDTVLNSADFFVRLKGHFNEVKIFETIKNKHTIALNTLRF